MAEIIQSFAWTGIDNHDKRVSGVILAPDSKAAELILKNKGITVINISLKQARGSFSFSMKKRVKAKEIILFTRYLAAMLGAGMPILKALDVIAHDQGNEVWRSVVTSIRTRVSSGTSLAEAMGDHPKYFSQLYRSLVSAGEKSATLDKILVLLGKYLDKAEMLKRKIRNALIYPASIVVISLGVTLVLLVFVIPQFQSMFQSAGVKLPYFTQIVISLSTFVRTYWWLLFIVLLISFFGIRYLKRNNPAVANWFDTISLRIWIVGPILRKAIISRFTRTLSITLQAGLPIVESMKAMVPLMGNKQYSEGVDKICSDLTSGHELAASMESTHLFPNMVIQMVSVGEASSKLEEMLNNVANYYEEDVNSIAENLSTLIEPVIIIVLGVIIGAFVIAMYLPIFKLGSTI